LTIQGVQRAVADVWTLDGYTDQFRANDAPHRDFAHAVGHVQKAAGRLFDVVDAYDHGRATPSRHDVGKYIADLVICAARLANTTPTGLLDLDRIVGERLDEIRQRG
jgi:hypothetical protein